MKINQYYSIQLISIFFLIISCSKKEVVNFEDHLIPSIQVKNELRFYNLQGRMEHYHVPGLSMVIIKDGKMILNKGYGFSRTDDSIKIDSKTIFQAGSIAKTITAVGIMKLVDKGILNLDENIDVYLKSWKFTQNPYTEKTPITLRMLLSHSAGIIHNNYKGYPQNEDLPSLNTILNGIGKYKPAGLDTIPGVRYKYSNTGYGIIERIVEDVTGKPFEVVLNEEVFIPFKMTNSTFERKLKKDNENVSYAYNKKGEIVKGYWYNASIKAGGGLWTTAEDLAKFTIQMQQKFSKDQLVEMITPVKANYGLGFNIKGEKDSIIFYHSGKNVGYTNFMIGYGKKGDAIIVLTNADNGGYLFSEIIRGISDLYNWDFMKPKELETVAVSKEVLESYLGTFTLKFQGETYTITIEKEGNNLKLIDEDENITYPLRALSKTKFRDINDGEKVDFIKDEKGEIILLWDEEYKFIRVAI